MAQYHHIERVNCDWHIFATKNILTLNSANYRHTTTMSTSTMRSTTHELSNVCLLSESEASVDYKSVSRQGPFNVSVSALNYHYTVWLVCTRQRTRNVGHCLPSISGLMRCFDSFSSDNPDFKSRLETRSSNVFLVFERIKSNISELQVLCLHNTTHFKNIILWKIYISENSLTLNSADSRFTTIMSTSTMRSTTRRSTMSNTMRSTTRSTNEPSNICLLSESEASVDYKSVSRQGPFNVSVSALNYHYTVWFVCTRQRARNVGQCSLSNSGLMRCFDSYSSDTPEFKTRLVTRGSNVFLVFERIKSNISELQVLFVQNTTHFKNIMLWKMYISDMNADQLSHQTTHDYDLKDHYEDFILPIIIVVPTSVLTLLVIIICTIRRRRSSASRRASSALRAALGNRDRVASPAVSFPQNDQVALWLTTILARLQHAPAPRNGTNPPPYDEPPPYDSLSLTEFHATDISVRTISIVHDGVSESNDSDPPPPYPGV
ncbi:hypothetical protein Btru_073723 [Bulinus truncatus]|nr:hypothetical protein Btru_073723 [Bulinus truncatus]